MSSFWQLLPHLRDQRCDGDDFRTCLLSSQGAAQPVQCAIASMLLADVVLFGLIYWVL